ncbi:lytic murein transglycosylase B [Candidatus Vallotia lariciata]|uniref:lytic murein transglycosylase B n=1 Tax=Candidatus Vallotia laricis TaxID=2018052 RepID=UPI001D018CAE|nr:lytic murein transglycosylase B [Candidatus Vallotia lariciata]UDG83211.1 Membrane-bound lytic murein transglycosylase B [Candidatus Vallotia lariciata]
MTRWTLSLLLILAISRSAVANGSGQIIVDKTQLETSPLQNRTFEEEIVPQHYANHPGINAFINDMVAKYDLDAKTLKTLFNQAAYSKTAIKLTLSASKSTLKSWQAYQARLIEPLRINAGVKFWQQSKAALQRASKEFGVPPEVIVGIIGVETLYGRNMGNFRVLDTLTTLAFDYPETHNRAQRMALFRKNLEDFLLWTQNAGIEPRTVLGSYSGAIGIPQFLPSSIVKYAVDYKGNHRIDLRNSPDDAIGSVANYLKQHGWNSGRPVAWRIHEDAGSIGIAQAATNGSPEPRWALQKLLRAGMLLNENSVDIISEAKTPVAVIELPTPEQPTQYILGLRNFYVLTYYNHSFFYALAAYQLGERVRAQMEKSSSIQ